MGEDWEPEAGGLRLLGLRGCFVATIFPSVLTLSHGGDQGAGPTQPCLAGRGGICPHLPCTSLAWWVLAPQLGALLSAHQA